MALVIVNTRQHHAPRVPSGSTAPGICRGFEDCADSCESLRRVPKTMVGMANPPPSTGQGGHEPYAAVPGTAGSVWGNTLRTTAQRARGAARARSAP